MDREPVVKVRDEGERLRVLGTQVRFVCNAEQTGKAWSLMEVLLPENAGPPPHDHPWDEAYYVVEGSVRFSLAGEERLVRAGDFVYAPGGTLHGFKGAAAAPSRMLIFDAPAHAEAFFRDCEREVRDLPADLAKVPDIGDRHQIRFVRP
jgi:quercetin dioxygenase-like cupin family protein